MRELYGSIKLKSEFFCILLKTYVGDIYEEKKHGKGVLSWSDGRIYTGAFFADRRHGFGTFHTPGASDFKV